MSPTLVTILTLVGSISWTIVYVDIINRGFKDKTYGMPLFGPAFKISWLCIFTFLVGDDFSLQMVVTAVWFILDAVIACAYFQYGGGEFPREPSR